LRSALLVALALSLQASALSVGLGDWGLPTPFSFYPRGPGYVLTSFSFDTLVWKDERGVIPWLAYKWEANGTAVKFYLREAKWSDGEPLTAEDVVFTFKYLMKHGWHWKNIPKDLIKDVKALDDRTVVVELSRPFPFFVEEYATTVFVLPKHVWEKVKDPFSYRGKDAFVCSGPYVLKEYVPGSRYVFVRNPFFWGPKPKYEELVVSAVGPFQPQKAVAALIRGEVDSVSLFGKAYRLVELAKRAKPDLIVKRGPSYWVLFLGFNLDEEPYSFKEFRKAVAMSLDLKELVELSAGPGAAEPGSPGYVPPYSRFYEDDVPKYRYDPEAAARLLKSVGVEDVNGDGCAEFRGRPWRPLLVTTKQFVQEALIVKKMLKRVKICVNVKVVPGPKQLDLIVKGGGYGFVISGHGAVGNDPLAAAWWFERFSAPWRDPRYLELARELLNAPSAEEAIKVVKEIQRLVAEELPRIALYYPYQFLLDSSRAGWFFTEGGIDGGVPLPFNKLALLR